MSAIEKPERMAARLWPGGIQSRRAGKDAAGLNPLVGDVRGSVVAAVRARDIQIAEMAEGVANALIGDHARSDGARSALRSLAHLLRRSS